MINEETIVSVYNDKMTLLQFLKTVNKALDEAVLTSVEVSKKGNATLSFVFEFADGTKIESGEIVLQQGESVTDAKIVDGHLYLTLSNDERLDAGNVKPVTRFEISASQHLIVYYGDGTSQDLGAILQGNVNIDGNLTANSIIENMSGYSISDKNANVTFNYAGVVKNGNKLTIALFFNFKLSEDLNVNIPFTICNINLPLDVANKLETTAIEGVQNIVNNQKQVVNYALNDMQEANLITYRYGQSLVINLSPLETPMLATRNYIARVEMTFLLSDNMVAQQ